MCDIYTWSEHDIFIERRERYLRRDPNPVGLLAPLNVVKYVL